MKPEDFRNATFEDLQGILQGQRERVYLAWVKFGPGTTAEVAIKDEMSLLSFRPRTTELIDLGLVELEPGQKIGHEGKYRAVSMDEWRRRREAAPVKPEQMLMRI